MDWKDTFSAAALDLTGVLAGCTDQMPMS